MCIILIDEELIAEDYNLNDYINLKKFLINNIDLNY